MHKHRKKGVNMKIPIRMIGIATTIFWILLIGFFVSAVYSVKDLKFSLGEPEIDVTSNNKILFSLPMTIDNEGYYNIGAFNVTTKIVDEEGVIVTQGFTFISVIKKGEEIATTHNMTIDIDELLKNNQDCLFNDTELEIHETISMEIAEVIPVQASMNVSMPWGAPLYNFTVGEVEYTTFNQTHMQIVVPISFENHALFDLNGSIQIYMYNSTNVLLGEGETTLEAQQNSFYQGYIELTIPTTEISENGYFEIYFATPFFNYGPLVIPNE